MEQNNTLVPNNEKSKLDFQHTESAIESMIMVIRDQQVMLDHDLATLYNVETKALNQAVKRNIKRFPSNFRFQLSEEETIELVTNCDRLEKMKHSSTLPFAFTEQGVAMLSAVLRSQTALRVSIQIMRERDRFHDRFLIIDDTVYHLGASLKDLGKKLFAFSRMEVGADGLLR